MLGKASVFLIGPMGSGKTAVGRHLSRALGLPFYDSDAEIERRTGVDIAFIFEKEGEAGFRQREREALEALTLLARIDRKSTRLNSSHSQISYAVFCLKKKKKQLATQHDGSLSKTHHRSIALS